MAMAHKAFVFDWRAFESDLAASLSHALGTGDIATLARFIADNLPSLSDPSTGRSLARDWEASIATGDAHQYGDVALTKFYDPRQDIGLGDQWEEVEDYLKTMDVDPAIILGAPFGPRTSYFDPGKMGSYFQTPDEAARHLRILQDLSKRLSDAHRLDEAIALFRQAGQMHRGVYITF